MALIDRFGRVVRLEAARLGYSVFQIEEEPDCVRVVASGKGKPVMRVTATLRELYLNKYGNHMAALASHRVNNAYRTANNG